MILLLHRGHQHKFEGDIYDQEALIDFAIEKFSEAAEIEQIPIMPTIWDELRDLFNYSVRHKGGLIPALLMKDEEGNVSYLALFGVYVLPLLLIWGLYKLMQLPFETEEDTV